MSLWKLEDLFTGNSYLINLAVSEIARKMPSQAKALAIRNGLEDKIHKHL